MKRAYFYIDSKDHQALAREVRGMGGSLSEFVREAVQEKLERDRAVQNAHQVREELSSLVEQMREEVLRMRQDLAQDTQRHLTLIREDANKSLRKSAEAQNVFLKFLGGSLAGPEATKSPSRRDDDGPPAIPG